MSKFKIEAPDSEFLDSDFMNHIKIEFLLRRAGVLLRDRFRQLWKYVNQSEWDDDVEGNCERFIGGIGQKVFERLGQIQKDSILSGNIKEWDLTTLTDILMNANFNGPIGKTERYNLKTLKDVRNKCAHNPQTGTMTDRDFEELWTKAADALLNLGDSEVEICKLKVSTNLAEFDSRDENLLNCSTETDKLAENAKLAETLKDEGNALQKSGKHKEAIDVYTRAIKLQGLDENGLGILYSNRSGAYLDLSNKQESQVGAMCWIESAKHALEDAKQAIKLRPAWYRGYYRCAKAYYKLGKYYKATRSSVCALSLAPKYGRRDLIHLRDMCRRKLVVDLRNEHVVISHVPKTKEDLLKLLKKQGMGIDIDKEQVDTMLKIQEKIPGQVDVQKAHLLMKEAVPKFGKAVQMYTKAAALGNAEGTYYLALCYKIGCGVKQDVKMYIGLLMMAAATEPVFNSRLNHRTVGVAEAEHALGLAYQEGVGVDQNWSEAIKWYKLASEHECSSASNNLGHIYMDGRGVPKNTAIAIDYWKLAARQGSYFAMNSLADY